MIAPVPAITDLPVVAVRIERVEYLTDRHTVLDAATDEEVPVRSKTSIVAGNFVFFAKMIREEPERLLVRFGDGKEVWVHLGDAWKI